jgi:hypothetical protein
MRTAVIRTGRATFALAVVALTIHLTLLGSWRWSILPGLEDASGGTEAVSVLDPLPAAPGSWRAVDECGVRMRVPGPPYVGASPLASGPANAGCTVRLPIGWIHVRRGPVAESHFETIALLAPLASDVRLLAPPWRNWRVIVAIARRTQRSPGGAVASRFGTATARGAVISYDNHGVERHVIYAFGSGPCRGRLVTVTRAPASTVRRILGTLDVCPTEET